MFIGKTRTAVTLRRTSAADMIGLEQKEGLRTTGTFSFFMGVVVTRIPALYEHSNLQQPAFMLMVVPGSRQVQYSWPPPAAPVGQVRPGKCRGESVHCSQLSSNCYCFCNPVWEWCSLGWGGGCVCHPVVLEP